MATVDEIRAIVARAEADWWCPSCDAFVHATYSERCVTCNSCLGEHTTAHAKTLLAALDAEREAKEQAEAERGPSITRADARELLEMSDLTTPDACYERVRAALRAYAGGDFECHQPMRSAAGAHEPKEGA